MLFVQISDFLVISHEKVNFELHLLEKEAFTNFFLFIHKRFEMPK